MKISILYLMILACAFLPFEIAAAQEISYKVNETNKLQTAYIAPGYTNSSTELKQKSLEYNLNSLLQEMEFDTIKLEKGRKFFVISEQNLNNNSVEGIPVRFDSVQKEYLAYNKAPSKITFHGIIEKAAKPRLAGKSGTVKVKLEKITVDNITYPVEALITKMDNKNVHMGVLVAPSKYLNNLADTANDGIIHNSIKDPCGSDTCSISTIKKPFVFLGAAALQAADLLLSPIVAIGKRGNDVYIPLNTYFEIKLDKELYVLDLQG